MKESIEADLLDSKREQYVGVPSNFYASLQETCVNKEMTIPSKKGLK